MLKQELLEDIKRFAIDDTRLLRRDDRAKWREIKRTLRELSDLGFIRLIGRFGIELVEKLPRKTIVISFQR